MKDELRPSLSLSPWCPESCSQCDGPSRGPDWNCSCESSQPGLECPPSGRGRWLWSVLCSSVCVSVNVFAGVSFTCCFRAVSLSSVCFPMMLWYRRALSTRMALSLFWSWERPCWHSATVPEEQQRLCVKRIFNLTDSDVSQLPCTY